MLTSRPYISSPLSVELSLISLIALRVGLTIGILCVAMIIPLYGTSFIYLFVCCCYFGTFKVKNTSKKVDFSNSILLCASKIPG